MKKVLISFAICIVTLPVAAIATFVLTPFWRWFETERKGTERKNRTERKGSTERKDRAEGVRF